MCDLHNYPIALQSLCYLLNFIEEHNVSLVHCLQRPTSDNHNDRVLLGNHTLQQLNILDVQENVGPYSSVVKLAFANCEIAILFKVYATCIQKEIINNVGEWVILKNEKELFGKAMYVKHDLPYLITRRNKLFDFQKELQHVPNIYRSTTLKSSGIFSEEF